MAPKMTMVEEFKAFLTKHGVIGLAIGVVIGGAVGKLIKSLVDNLIMPIVGMLTPSGDWRTIKIGPFGVGDFAGNLVDFVIVAFVIFMIIKILVKEKPAAPGPAMKQCSACKESVLAEASKCKFCASEVR